MTRSSDYRGLLTNRLLISLFITVGRLRARQIPHFRQKSTDSSTAGRVPFSCERVQRRWKRLARGWEEDEKASAQVKAGLFF